VVKAREGAEETDPKKGTSEQRGLKIGRSFSKECTLQNRGGGGEIVGVGEISLAKTRSENVEKKPTRRGGVEGEEGRGTKKKNHLCLGSWRGGSAQSFR